MEADLVYVNGPRLLPAAALARLRVPVLFHAHSCLPPGASRMLAGMSLRRMRAQRDGDRADSWRSRGARMWRRSAFR